METYDLVLSGNKIFINGSFRPAQVGIRSGQIVAVEERTALSGKEVLETGDHLVLPGVIDSQVHFRWPGLDHKEDLATGSQSAVLGGVCTYFEMPNTNPPTITAELMAQKLQKAAEVSWAHYGFFVGATGDNTDVLPSIYQQKGVCGIKIFFGSSTGNLLLNDHEKIKKVFALEDIPISIHAEDEDMLRAEFAQYKNNYDVKTHPQRRSVAAALSATQQLIALAKEMGRKIHLLHISSGDEMDFLKNQKDHCTVELTPQHLFFTAPDCYEKLGSYAQMNPPLREEKHRSRLFAGLRAGTVDVMGSDHAPHTREEKEKTYPASPSGMPGVQTFVPMIYHLCQKYELPFEKVVPLITENQAKLFRLKNKGFIKPHYDGDFTIIDPQKKHTFLHGEMATKSGWTPYHEITTQGHPVMTILKGQIVMREGKLVGTPQGQAIEHL